MKIRWRNTLSINWIECDLSQLSKILVYPQDTIEVRMICKHKYKVNIDGIKRCAKCGDFIKVTSFRD